MFTGIIEETGILSERKQGVLSAQIRICCRKVLQGTKIGDSIAVNGICLTVTSLASDSFTADVMAETMRRSSLSETAMQGVVNLERAMAADGRFGGHMVSGHMDWEDHCDLQRRECRVVYLADRGKAASLYCRKGLRGAGRDQSYGGKRRQSGVSSFSDSTYPERDGAVTEDGGQHCEYRVRRRRKICGEISA